MANPRKLEHVHFPDMAIPYATGNSNAVTGAKGTIFIAGSNLIVLRGGSDQDAYEANAQIRPNFGTGYGDITASSPALTIGKYFGWKRWGGDFYVMLHGYAAGQDPHIYKKRIGTDANFVNVGTVTGAGTGLFTFVSSNNTVYMGNGTSGSMYKWDATNFWKWGITAPSAVATTSTGTTGITATIGWQYVYCYYNSTTGHVSSPSPVSASTGAVSNKTVTVTVTATTDTQADKIRVFRTADGGGGIYYELSNSPIANPGSGTTTIADTTADTSLSSVYAPLNGVNDPPPALKGFELYAGRVWGFKDDKAYFSAFEESVIGVPEESFPSRNYFQFGKEVTGLKRVADGLLIFTGSDVWKVSGDSLSNFRVRSLFAGMGLRAENGLTSGGGLVYWLSSEGTIRATDGYSQVEIGGAIRSTLAGFVATSAALVHWQASGFDMSNPSTYVMLMVPNISPDTCYVYDLRQRIWFVPWTMPENLAYRTLASVEITAGQYALLTSAGQYVWQCTTLSTGSPSVPRDGLSSGSVGNQLAGSFTTSGVRIAPEGMAADLEYISLEHSALGTNVLKVEIIPENDFTATATDITANQQNPPLKTQPANFQEHWYWYRSTLLKRAILKVSLLAPGTGAVPPSINSFGFVSKVQQDAG